MVGRLGAARQPNRDRAQCLGQIGQQHYQPIVAFEGDRRALDRLDRALNVRGERDERMEGSDLAPGGEGGLEDLGAEQAAGVNHGLAAVEAHRIHDRRDSVVRHGKDHQLHFVEDRGRLHESVGVRDEGAETIAPARIAAGDGGHRPARPADRHSQGGPDGSRPDDADGRRALGAAAVRMRIEVSVDLVAVTVTADLPTHRGWPRAAVRGRAGGVAAMPPGLAPPRASASIVVPELHAALLPIRGLAVSLRRTCTWRLVAAKSRRNAVGRRPPGRV